MPTIVQYYGQRHQFDVVLTDEQNVEFLDINTDYSCGKILNPTSDCIFSITDSAIPVLTSTSFNQFGGGERIKSDVRKFVISPVKKYVRIAVAFSLPVI